MCPAGPGTGSSAAGPVPARSVVPMDTNQQLGRRTAVIVVTLVGAAVVWALARATGVDLLVKSGSGTRAVGLASVLVVALVAGVGALAVTTLVSRSRRSRPRRLWAAVGIPLLLASLAGPLGAASAGAGLALASMHVVVGVILIVGMGRTLPARRAEGTVVAAAPEQEARVR